MRVSKYVFILFFIISLFIITACDSKEKQLKTENLTYRSNEYTISVDTPKDKEYKIIEGIVEEAKNSYKNAEYTIVGDKLRIEIDEADITFTESDFYTKKYGKNKEKTWANYKQYVLDDEITHLKQHGIELITVDGIESVQYKIYWDSIEGYDGVFRTIDSYSISNKYQINIYIFPSNENDKIEELLKDEEVKVILNSLKVTKN